MAAKTSPAPVTASGAGIDTSGIGGILSATTGSGSPVTGINTTQATLHIWAPTRFGSDSQQWITVADWVNQVLNGPDKNLWAQSLNQANILPAPTAANGGKWTDGEIRTALETAATTAAGRSDKNVGLFFSDTIAQQQAQPAQAAGSMRVFKGANTEVNLTPAATVEAVGNAVAQTLIGRRLSAKQVFDITADLNSQEYQEGAARVATNQAQQVGILEAYQGAAQAEPGGTGGGTATVAAATPQQLAQLAYNAGFRGQALTTAVAVAMAESSGNTGALNDNASTGDYSVGAWQVNYFGKLMQERTAKYGAPQVLQANPQGQAAAAFDISGGGKDFSAWTTYTSGAYQQYMGEAQQAASAVKGPAPVNPQNLTGAQGAPLDIAAPGSSNAVPGSGIPPAAASAPANQGSGSTNPIPTLPQIPAGSSASVNVGSQDTFTTPTGEATITPARATITPTPQTPEQATASYLMNQDSGQFQAENLTNIFAAMGQLLGKNAGAAKSAGSPVTMQ